MGSADACVHDIDVDPFTFRDTILHLNGVMTPKTVAGSGGPKQRSVILEAVMRSLPDGERREAWLYEVKLVWMCPQHIRQVFLRSTNLNKWNTTLTGVALKLTTSCCSSCGKTSIMTKLI
mmetsp:Transcript_98042/g.218623  ORF Transcript_98042/g.218623 Transcript_98042/m.218623 type:complete len:120 (+) Transcript_98042:2054-2413(+)